MGKKEERQIKQGKTREGKKNNNSHEKQMAKTHETGKKIMQVHQQAKPSHWRIY